MGGMVRLGNGACVLFPLGHKTLKSPWRRNAAEGFLSLEDNMGKDHNIFVD